MDIYQREIFKKCLKMGGELNFASYREGTPVKCCRWEGLEKGKAWEAGSNDI